MNMNEDTIHAMHNVIEKLGKQLAIYRDLMDNASKDLTSVTLKKVNNRDGFQVLGSAKVSLVFYANDTVVKNLIGIE